jgi:hypothetical protein
MSALNSMAMYPNGGERRFKSCSLPRTGSKDLDISVEKMVDRPAKMFGIPA